MSMGLRLAALRATGAPLLKLDTSLIFLLLVSGRFRWFLVLVITDKRDGLSGFEKKLLKFVTREYNQKRTIVIRHFHQKRKKFVILVTQKLNVFIVIQ